MFIALTREVEQRLGDFNPQVLANTAWAFATLGQADAQLFTALAREAERHLGDFSPQELANTARAFVTLRRGGNRKRIAMYAKRQSGWPRLKSRGVRSCLRERRSRKRGRGNDRKRRRHVVLRRRGTLSS